MSWAYLCSVDSLFASLALGLMGTSRTAQTRFVAAFALCDSIAVALGAASHSLVGASGGDGVIPLLAAMAALIGLSAAAWKRRFSAALVAIPLLLSLDNFAAALREGPAVAASSTLVAGLASGAFAWCGFAVAATVVPGFHQHREGRDHHHPVS